MTTIQSRRLMFIAGLLVVFALVAVFTATSLDWSKKRNLHPSGGRYFFHRVELPVPQFHQDDEAWRDDQLGWSNGTLGSEGCAVASTAMVLKFYGIDTDPKQLNEYLTASNGYTDEGWIYWERAAWLAPDRVEHIYEDLPSYWLIDSNLSHGNPVIVRIRLQRGITHFVVIVGKDGYDYLIRDPGAGGVKGVYPLSELGSDIEALRFYKKL